MRFATTRARRVWFNPPPVPVDERDAFVHIPGTDRAAGLPWPPSKRG
jgi:hypothetical protein